MSKSKVKLGDKCRDKVSGFTGVAVAEHLYLNGCRRVSLQPAVDKDGKLPDIKNFDDPQLKVVTAKVAKRDNTTGGPSKYEDAGRDVGH